VRARETGDRKQIIALPNTTYLRRQQVFTNLRLLFANGHSHRILHMFARTLQTMSIDPYLRVGVGVRICATNVTKADVMAFDLIIRHSIGGR
jgi:hypothetical protein